MREPSFPYDPGVASVEIVPASFPENIWSVGTVTASTRIRPDQLMERLDGATKPWRWWRWFRMGGDGWVHRDTPNGFHLWKSTFFRDSPSRGALLLDATILDDGSGAQIMGRLRMGTGLLAFYGYFAALLIVFFLDRTPDNVWLVFVGLALGQAVILRALAQRDIGRMSAVIEWAVADGEALP